MFRWRNSSALHYNWVFNCAMLAWRIFQVNIVLLLVEKSKIVALNNWSFWVAFVVFYLNLLCIHPFFLKTLSRRLFLLFIHNLLIFLVDLLKKLNQLGLFVFLWLRRNISFSLVKHLFYFKLQVFISHFLFRSWPLFINWLWGEKIRSELYRFDVWYDVVFNKVFLNLRIFVKTFLYNFFTWFLLNLFKNFLNFF